MTGRCNRAGTALAVIGLAAIAGTPAAAQSDYPNRPIQLVVPYGPGGVADVGMRIMAEKLSVRLKQNVVIENRPGAGGIVAAKAVATACARRLQRPDDRQQQRHRRGAVQVTALRHPEGLRFDLDGVVLRSSDHRQGRVAAEESAGRGQGGEGQSGQAQHRHYQSRQHAESRRRVVQERQRHPGSPSCRSAPPPTWRPRFCVAIST